jgi:hypothetical protein
MLRLVGVLGGVMRANWRNANPVITALPTGRMSARTRQEFDKGNRLDWEAIRRGLDEVLEQSGETEARPSP